MKKSLLLAAIATLAATHNYAWAGPPQAEIPQKHAAATSDKESTTAPAPIRDARAREILQALYGGAQWSDPALKEYFHDDTPGYVDVVFVANFTENHTQKQVALVHITPEPLEDYDCHACAPVIGGAVFAKTQDGWAIESQSKIVGWGNALGEQLGIVKVGPELHGIMIRIDDSHQGYEYKHVQLVVPNGAALPIALDVGFDESPGPAACADAEDLVEQHVKVSFAPGSNPQYFDVLADMLENEGTCDDYATRRTTARYVYAKGKYEAR